MMNIFVVLQIATIVLFLAGVIYSTLAIQGRNSIHLTQVMNQLEAEHHAQTADALLFLDNTTLLARAQFLLDHYSPSEIDSIGSKCQIELRELHQTMRWNSSTIREHQKQVREYRLLNLYSSVEIAARKLALNG